MCMMPFASFVSSFSCPRAEPRALFAMSKRLSKLTGPPSCVWACVLGWLGHAHICMCVYVCERRNLKQVSVISPVEALHRGSSLFIL